MHKSSPRQVILFACSRHGSLSGDLVFRTLVVLHTHTYTHCYSSFTADTLKMSQREDSLCWGGPDCMFDGNLQCLITVKMRSSISPHLSCGNHLVYYFSCFICYRLFCVLENSRALVQPSQNHETPRQDERWPGSKQVNGSL